MKVSAKHLDVFAVSDQPVTCPHCGSRTEFMNMTQSEVDRDIHVCLNDECEALFITEFDTEGD